MGAQKTAAEKVKFPHLFRFTIRRVRYVEMRANTGLQWKTVLLKYQRVAAGRLLRARSTSRRQVAEPLLTSRVSCSSVDMVHVPFIAEQRPHLPTYLADKFKF